MSEKKSYLIFLLFSGLYIIGYFGIVAFYAVNFPFYDDYSAILGSILKLENTRNTTEFIQQLTAQFNEHRIGFTRLIAYITTQFVGKIDLKVIVLIGNLALLVISSIFYRIFKKGKHSSILLFLPILFFIFNLQSYSNTFWAMASLQNFWIHAFAVLFFFGIFEKNILWNMLGIVALIFAVYTSGNGILLIPISIFIAFLLKKHKISLVLGLLGTLLIIAYFYNYQSSGDKYFLQNQSVTELLISSIKFLGIFGGAFFYHPSYVWVAMLAGWLMIAFFAFLFFQKYYLKNPALFGIYAFLVLTCFVVSLARIKLSIDFSIPSRYRINSMLLLCCFYLSSSQIFRYPRVAQYAVVSILFVYNIFINYFYFPKAIQAYELRIADTWLWQNGEIPTAFPMDVQEKFMNILQETNQKDLFSPIKVDEKQLVRLNNFSVEEIPTSDKIEYEIDWIREKDGLVALKGWAKFKNQKANFQKVDLGFVEADSYVSVPALYQIRYDLVQKNRSFDYLESGFLVFFPKEKLTDIRYLILSDSKKKEKIKLTTDWSKIQKQSAKIIYNEF